MNLKHKFYAHPSSDRFEIWNTGALSQTLSAIQISARSHQNWPRNCTSSSTSSLINNLAFFSPNSRTICIKLRTRASHHTVDSLYKIRADRIPGSLAIHHFGISEQTCCSSLVSNPFSSQLCRPSSHIIKSISSQFRSNRPTHSLTISKSNFSLNMSSLKSTDFARNSQANPSSLSSPLQLNADFHWIADTGATSHMTPHRHWFKSYTHCRTPYPSCK